MDEMTKICLAMIVKDEEKTIKRCLKAALPLIDYYVIADTGSTDKTKEVIKRTLKSKRGVIIDRPWVDFGTNRSEVFEEIHKLDDIDYALVLDADDVLHVEKGLKKKIELDADVYDVLIKTNGTDFYQRRLFSNKKTWKYFGVVHEFPNAIDGVETKGMITPLEMYIEHKGDGSSWKNEKEKYSAHVEELEKLPKPLSPRDQFYYAQSLLSAGRMQDAIKAYEDRIKMGVGDWDQEVVYSKYQIAKTYHNLGELDRATLAYMSAYQSDPERIEPLYQLCRMLRIAGKYALGYVFGKIAINTPMPAIGAKAFLEKQAWGADALNEFGICAYYTGKKEEAKAAWLIAQKMEMTPAIRESIEKNLEFVKDIKMEVKCQSRSD
jgi:glycosyltransferase involved in cell wall biosynthesis